MTSANYRPTLEGLWALAQLVEESPIEDMLAAAERADWVAAILDPTPYRNRARAMHEDMVGVGTIVPTRSKTKPQLCWKVSTRHGVKAVVDMLWPWLSARRRARAVEVLQLAEQGSPSQAERIRYSRLGALAQSARLSPQELSARGRRTATARWHPMEMADAQKS